MTIPARTVSRPHAWKGRRLLTPVVVALLVVASALAVTVLTRGSAHNTGDLDPANPGLSGAQALAHVLSDHGVTVIVVRSQRELLDQSVDAATTVAVTGTSRLSGRTAQTALTHSAAAASLVLLNPDPEVTKGMGLPVSSHLTDLTEVAAGCRGTAVGTGFRLAHADQAYVPTSESPGATTCFTDKTDGGGAMVSLPTTAARPPVTLVGDESLITNGDIVASDNAAIALRLFGATDRLIWYVPSIGDIAAADASSRSIAPAWFRPALVLGTSAVALLCLWRGRRLGRLVGEPLPVIVRAVETTESRGRMYRRSRDRTRALAVLQQATLKRLTSSLGLSATSPVSSVAAAAAAVSGREYLDVLHLLESPAAHDDSSLLQLANNLLSLEKEARGT
ncbi:MAG: DUF4350 domain-containing protein [Actinomycetota bacterium]